MKNYLPAVCAVLAIVCFILAVVIGWGFAFPGIIFCFLAAGTGLARGGGED